MKAAPFVRGLNFGEGLRWRDGRLWYSDFYQHTVSSVDESGEKRVELKLDDQPSGLGWLPDGRLLVVAMTSQRLLRREKDGSIALHADLKPHAKFHANDMLVDARGNAFIACFGFDLDHFIAEKGVEALWGEPGAPTAPILHVSPEGKVRVASPDHKFPNGMVLTGTTLIAAETFMPGFTAFDLGADGTLSNRRVWGTLPKDPPAVVPDGISIDREGAIWAANAVAAEVVRVGPGGKILERVETSQPAFACALGGKSGRQLFIATSGSANTEAATKEPRGLIEVATVSVPAP
jgi:sugar lactone lactonase YvrE